MLSKTHSNLLVLKILPASLDLRRPLADAADPQLPGPLCNRAIRLITFRSPEGTLVNTLRSMKTRVSKDRLRRMAHWPSFLSAGPIVRRAESTTDRGWKEATGRRRVALGVSQPGYQEVVRIIGKTFDGRQSMLMRTAMSLVVFLLLFHANTARGSSTDLRLLQLVPPDSAVVAGMANSSAQGRENSVLLMTHDNKRDLDDFFAVAGGDATRKFHALVFVKDGADHSKPGGHSLLIGGHFDREVIFRFQSIGAVRKDYRGVGVLVVPAFAREQDSFNEVRWLAILDAEIAIFGSVESVERELDRWIDRQPTDTLLLEKFNALNRHEDTWCLLAAVPPGGLAEIALGKLDAKLGDLATEGRPLGYGIRFGRKIEIIVSADPPANRTRSAADDPRGVKGMAALNFLASSTRSEAASSVVKVSRRRYEEWVAGFGARDPHPAVRTDH